MRSKSKPDRPRPSKNSSTAPRLNLWHGCFFVLGILVAFAVPLIIPSTGHGSLDQKSMQAPPALVTGPWGQVKYTTIDLERPDESFPEGTPPPQPITWWFPNLSQPEIEAILRKSEMTPPQIESLADKTRWRAITNGWQILPSVELVRDLSLPARKAIYAVLKQTPLNIYIQNPVRIEPAKFPGWLAKSGLAADKQELVRRLSMPEGEMTCFYDSQLLEWLCAPEEKKSYAKAITQTSALLMRLHIDEGADLDALARYWGRGNRAQTMKPLLEALARVPGGANISVSFLFPTFARMRLYTYPDSRHDQLAYHEDCFWTAMNFFNDTPDYGFFEAEKIKTVLRNDYTEVSTNWSFGDVIMVVDERQQALHMCVYVADGVVFTKNGATFLAPWVLMKMPEMMKHYTGTRPVQMLVFRKKSV